MTARSAEALAFRRLARDGGARAAAAILATLLLLAALAPWLPLRPYSEPRASDAFRPPAWSSLAEAGRIGPILGCDHLGRCVLSRTLAGLGVSLLSAGAAALVSLAIGVSVGILAGARGGRTDAFVMRAIDVIDSVPLIFVVIFVQSFLRGVHGGDRAPGLQMLVFFATLGAVTWLTMARLVRATARSLCAQGFVIASRTLGASGFWIVRRHVLRNLIPVILVALTITIPRILLFESFLSFLGLGVEPPEVSLGSLARSGLDAVSAVLVRPWLVAAPSVVLAALLVCVNVLGDAVRDAFDPRLSPAAGGAANDDAPSEESPPPPPSESFAPLLVVRDLDVAFRAEGGMRAAARGVSFAVGLGRCLAIVGESGSGKSATALGLLGLLPEGAVVRAAEARFDGEDLLSLPPARRRMLLGARIGFVPQDPIGALAPHLFVGDQVAEVLRAHGAARTAAEADAAVVSLFEDLQIPDPSRRLRQYPHELSGGLNQRVLIAMALALKPDLIVADEPTTALDVSVQMEILRLLRRIVRERGVALVLVSHDLGVVAGLADDVVVMERGRIVERGVVDDVLTRPRSRCAREILDARRALVGAPPRGGAP